MTWEGLAPRGTMVYDQTNPPPQFINNQHGRHGSDVSGYPRVRP